MLLKNFIVSIASGVATPTTSDSSSNPLFRKATTGTGYQIRSGSISTIYSASGSAYNNTTGSNGIDTTGKYKGIVLGTGTTPPAYSDFRIEAPVEPTGYSNNSYSVSADCQQVLTQSYTNKSSEDIIVTELGLFVCDQESSTYSKILLTRNVISPVTIKPNETKTFTIKIDYNKFSDAYSAS